MKKYLFFLLLLAIASCSSPKTKVTPLTNYDISVTLAMPSEFMYDPYFAQEVDSLNVEYKNLSKKYSSYKKYAEERDSLEYYYNNLLSSDSTLSKERREYLKRYLANCLDIRRDATAKKIDSLIFHILQRLSCNTYTLKTYKSMLDFSFSNNKNVEPFHYVLIADTTTVNSKDSFVNLATFNKTQFVLNVKKVNIRHYDNCDSATMHFQLFDAVNDRFIFDDEFTVILPNEEVKNTKTSSRVNKYIDYLLSTTTKDVAGSIIQNSWLMKQNRLETNKIKQYVSNLLGKQADLTWAKNLVKRDIDLGIISKYYDPDKMYCLIENEEKTKFISIFLHEDKNRWYGKKNVTKHEDVDDHLYKYFVVGEKYKDEWYLEAVEPTEIKFDTTINYKESIIINLLQHDFFDVNKMIPTQNLWSKGIFKKVKDIFVVPKYKNTSIVINNYSERTFRPYRELTLFVAEQYRKVVSMEYEEKEYSLFPLLEKLEIFAKHNYENLTYIMHRNNLEKRKLLIYDKEMTKILIPYFVKLPSNEIEVSAFYYDNIHKYLYRLNHKKIFPKITNKFDKEIEDYFLPYIWKWDDLYMLDDSFWNEVVLIKENDQFINLTKIELE